MQRMERQGGWAVSLLLLVAWVWLYAPVWEDLGAVFDRQEFGANQLALLGALALAAMRLHTLHLPQHLDMMTAATVGPQLFWPGLLMMSGGSLLYALAQHCGYQQGFSASLFGLASYGLAGLWMRPQRWWQGLPTCVLLVGALPFGEYLHVFIGFPMRLITAMLVWYLLSLIGLQPLSSLTILAFENGVTQIDVPCSGVRSLWAIWMFLAAATWIERRRFGIRWMGVVLACGLLLFFANLLRVLALTLLGPVAGWPRLAEMVHLPMGVLDFVGTCLVGLRLLRMLPTWKEPAPGEQASSVWHSERPAWLVPVLVVMFLGMGLGKKAWPRPSPAVAMPNWPPDWPFPAEFVTRPSPLTAGERESWDRIQPEAVDRRWFSYWPERSKHTLSGSMILVVSQNWQAQHRPEDCFTVYGLKPVESSTYVLRPDFPLRVLLLNSATDQRRWLAAYWFQSAIMTTEDYSTRVWFDLLPEHQRWVMVTLLFDEAAGTGSGYDPAGADFRALFEVVHAAVETGLK